MGLFRVLQFPVEDSYFGSYMCRMPVIPEDYRGEIQTMIAYGSHRSAEEAISDLEYYGVGSSFIDLFTDLRFNNIPLGTPPSYDSGFLIHTFYPNIEYTNERSDVVLSNTVKVFDSIVGLKNIVTVGQNASHVDNTTAFWSHDGDQASYILEHGIVHTNSDNTFYGFTIYIYGVFAGDMNGNKFNFDENATSPLLQIGVSYSDDDTWDYGIYVFDLHRPIGLSLKNAMSFTHSIFVFK